MTFVGVFEIVETFLKFDTLNLLYNLLCMYLNRKYWIKFGLLFIFRPHGRLRGFLNIRSLLFKCLFKTVYFREK